MILGIDPGIKGVSLAGVDQSGEVIWSHWVDSPKNRARGSEHESSTWVALVSGVVSALREAPTIEIAIIEFPQVYVHGNLHRGGRADDLLQLAAVAGALSFAVGLTGCRIHTPRPREWKGQVPKHAHHARLREVLTPEEVALVTDTHPRRYTGDGLDAVALARWGCSLLPHP